MKDSIAEALRENRPVRWAAIAVLLVLGYVALVGIVLPLYVWLIAP